MGFPSQFNIPVSDTRAYQQFGNSVVVPVIEAIARSMANAVEHELPWPEGEYLEGWEPKGTPDLAPPIRRRRRAASPA